jgi:hypothetical protein
MAGLRVRDGDDVRRRHLPDPPLDEPLEVDRAGGVVAEAVVERVRQVADAQVPPAPVVGPVQERTVVRAVLVLLPHANRLPPRPTR